MTTTRTSIAFLLASLLSLGAAVAYAGEAPKTKDPKMVEVATCVDGKVYSNLTGEHRGACSGHQGVLSWKDGSPVKSHARKSSYR